MTLTPPPPESSDSNSRSRIPTGPDLAACLGDALRLVALAPAARCAEHNQAAAEEDRLPVVEDLARDLGDRFAKLRKNPDARNWAQLKPFQFVERVAAVVESVADGPWRERWSAIREQLAPIQLPDDAAGQDWYRQIVEREDWLGRVDEFTGSR
jgi:hypothetical protein